MTLNEIIRRDLEFCRREEEAEAARQSLAEYEREINRRLWRRRIKAAFKVLAEVAYVALLAAVAFVALLAVVAACAFLGAMAKMF